MYFPLMHTKPTCLTQGIAPYELSPGWALLD